jgi:hypothetical protein
MKYAATIFICFFVLLLTNCKQHHRSGKEPLIPKDLSNEKERTNTLFVFIGEKIDVSMDSAKTGDFDKAFIGKYKVVERIYGNYEKDTIEFEAYDHFGYPSFAEFKNVMLFLSQDSGRYYHEKYQFYDVYKTIDNEWAGPFTIDYNHPDNKEIKPVKMKFAEEVSYSIDGVDEEEKRLWYPKPYYTITGNKAIAIYGGYIPDLFRLQKNTVLKARGLF